jgi:hypothetical protein
MFDPRVSNYWSLMMGNMQRFKRAVREGKGVASPGKPLADMNAARGAYIRRVVYVVNVMAILFQLIEKKNAIRNTCGYPSPIKLSLLGLPLSHDTNG